MTIKERIKGNLPAIRPFSTWYVVLLFVAYYTSSYQPPSPTQCASIQTAKERPQEQGIVAINEKQIESPPLIQTLQPTLRPTLQPTLQPTVQPTVQPTLPPRMAMNISASKLQTPCFAQKTAQQAKELFDIPDFATCTELHSCLVQQNLTNKWEISKLTRCPIPDRWLSGYMEKHQQQKDDVFVAMYFGCNKGYDAMHTAELISGRTDVFGKGRWRETLQLRDLGACSQGADDPESHIVAAVNTTDATTTTTTATKHNRPVNVHCIEAMPDMADRLEQSAIKTTANQHGFLVHNYAVSGTPGGTPILFPNIKPGYEAFTMDSCNSEEWRPRCKEVPTITIDEYVARHVDTAYNNNTSPSSTSIGSSSKRIPFVSIDIEGYDYTAMQAATRTLYRTDYLEFEYHGVGDWGKQSLKHAIDFLDSIGFVCYWSGKNVLWRITRCWMDHFDFHHWSNVACVAPQHQPELAAKMEQVFRETMLE